MKNKKKMSPSMMKTIAVLCVVLAIVLGTGIKSAVDCFYLNSRIASFLEDPITEETTRKIENIDTEISAEGLWGKLFLRHQDAYSLRKQENETYIEERAAALRGRIAALQPCTAIPSEAAYRQMRGEIEDMLVSDSTPFGKRLLEKVDNYGDLERYVEDFQALKETYKVKCSGCGGKGRIFCSNCNGKGKKLVTWYSEGDWGFVSHSTYDCTSCDGKGKLDCRKCDNGYYYAFH